tara:strand:+ start:850 stop:3297 length:2448 start_codon:yes stop_codon:yes gene_type:complete
VAGTVVIDLTAKDNVSQTLNKVDGQAKKLNKTFVDSRGKLRNARGQFAKMSKTAGTARQSFKLLGTTFSTYLAPLVAFGAAVKAVTGSLAVFSQREKDTAALANGLKGMTTDGNAALASLKASADELGKATLFNEEDFTKGFKLLTSFKTIGVSSYEEVAGTAADMAQVLDQDVNSVLLQVAKALEAPEVGLTALQRSGTRFTDAQKKQVKAMVAANKTAKAQAFILKELKRQYGGAAEAAATGFAGAMDTLGEVTRDAMEGLGALIEPGVVAGINLISKGVEKLTSFFKGLADAVLPKAQAAFEPIFEVMKNIFERVDLEGAANLIGNILVVGAQTFFDALSLITPVIAKISEGLFNLLENSPFGFMVQGIMKVAEHLGLTQPLVKELEGGARGAANGFQDIAPAVDASVEAQKRKIEALKTSVGLVEQEKNKVLAQEQAYNNSVKITNARLTAESEINKLQGQILERAYDQATSARQRLQIAGQIYQNEVEGARIAYQQTLNSIEAEKQRLQFRLQTAQVEANIIQAKGELAAAEAESNEKAQLILEKTRNAVEAQRENVRVIQGQITAQGKIAQQQIRAADAVLRQKELAAQSKLEQKLIGDKLVRNKQEARRVADGIAGGNTNARNLATATGQVASNARNSAHMFIRVADNANSAARAIERAAAAQRELNAARARARAAQAAQEGVEQAEGGYNRGSFKAFARGGVVKGPTLGLIGEGGEPEYIIPQSKAAGFAANFLSGKRGAGAIPGFAEGGVAMPSTANVSIQTGPVTQMNGQNFVTTQEMSKAVQAGVQQTLDLIRRDGNTRARLGF